MVCSPRRCSARTRKPDSVDPVLTAADFQAIMAVPSAHRAVALMQVGEDRASVPQELNRAFGASDGSHDMGYAALARRMNVPNIELRASETESARGIQLTGLYPVPQYKPEDGYTIDPSLVLAFIRIESRFQADAVSPMGARGLMQLMPATATKVGGSGAVSQLNDPSYNMSLGQRYIAQLLDQYGGNLIQVPSAYNAGPLKLAGWINARAGKEDDALLFIESIRVAETRSYVKRLLMYHWMYSRRMGQPTPSLDADDQRSVADLQPAGAAADAAASGRHDNARHGGQRCPVLTKASHSFPFASPS